MSTEGRQLRITNWDKVLYPETGFTKGDLIAYYARVAPFVLPHLHDRPLTLKRYPNGVDAPYFYEKQSPSHRPDWVQTVRIGDVNYTLAQDRPTLIWLANLADVELHTSLALAASPERPTMMVFDLDPGAPAGIVECCEVALVLRGLFDQLGLVSVAKTSGSKGLQVYVPLNTRTDYRATKPFARRVAELLEQRMPELVVSRMTKRLRPGKVLVDWSQNDEHKTTATVYSLRARERPTASTPVTWEEVQACRERGDERLLTFEAHELLARAEDQGDLFAAALERQAVSARAQLRTAVRIAEIGGRSGRLALNVADRSDHAAQPAAGRHRDVEGDDRRAAAEDASRRSRRPDPELRDHARRSSVAERHRRVRARDRRPHVGPRPRPSRQRSGQAPRRRVPRGARAADPPGRLASRQRSGRSGAPSACSASSVTCGSGSASGLRGSPAAA